MRCLGSSFHYTMPKIKELYAIVGDRERLLDPTAGTCSVSKIKRVGFSGDVYCNDMIDWGVGSRFIDGVKKWTFHDATHNLPYNDSFFDCIVFNVPCGMLDIHRDDVEFVSFGCGEKRLTYGGYYQGSLPGTNLAKYKFDNENFKRYSAAIAKESSRLLCQRGILVCLVPTFGKKYNYIYDYFLEILSNSGLKFIKTHHYVQIPGRRPGSDILGKIGEFSK